MHNSGQSRCLLATALMLSVFETLQPLAHARQTERKNCSKLFERVPWKHSRSVSVRCRALSYTAPLARSLPTHVTSRLHSTACDLLTYSGTSKTPLKLHGMVACGANRQTDMFRPSWSISLRHSLQPCNSNFQQVKHLCLSNYKQRYQHVVHSAQCIVHSA